MTISFKGERVDYLAGRISSIEKSTNTKITMRSSCLNGQAEITGLAENSKQALHQLVNDLITIHMQESKTLTVRIYTPCENRADGSTSDVKAHIVENNKKATVITDQRRRSKEYLGWTPTAALMEGSEAEGLTMQQPVGDPGAKRHGVFIE